MTTNDDTKFYEFEAPLNRDNGYTNEPIFASCKQTMTLLDNCIEWEAGSYYTCIGIIVNAHRELVDYDGVFELPEQAITLLERNGITVGEDFRE